MDVPWQTTAERNCHELISDELDRTGTLRGVPDLSPVAHPKDAVGG